MEQLRARACCRSCERAATKSVEQLLDDAAARPHHAAESLPLSPDARQVDEVAAQRLLQRELERARPQLAALRRGARGRRSPAPAASRGCRARYVTSRSVRKKLSCIVTSSNCMRRWRGAVTSTISAPPGSPHSCAAARNETAFAPELARHAASSCWCQVRGEPATRYTPSWTRSRRRRREPVLDLASRAELAAAGRERRRSAAGRRARAGAGRSRPCGVGRGSVLVVDVKASSHHPCRRACRAPETPPMRRSAPRSVGHGRIDAGRQRWTTGQVRVRVMPSTSWIWETTMRPSSSIDDGLGPQDHVVGAGHVVGLHHARDRAHRRDHRRTPCRPRSG